jgi:hypothetical protein
MTDAGKGMVILFDGYRILRPAPDRSRFYEGFLDKYHYGDEYYADCKSARQICRVRR